MAKVISKKAFEKSRATPRASANQVRKGWDDPDDEPKEDYWTSRSEYQQRAESMNHFIHSLDNGIRDLEDEKPAKQLFQVYSENTDSFWKSDFTYLENDILDFIKHVLPEEDESWYKSIFAQSHAEMTQAMQTALISYEKAFNRYIEIAEDLKTKARDKQRDLEGTIGY